MTLFVWNTIENNNDARMVPISPLDPIPAVTLTLGGSGPFCAAVHSDFPLLDPCAVWMGGLWLRPFLRFHRTPRTTAPMNKNIATAVRTTADIFSPPIGSLKLSRLLQTTT